MFSLQFLKLLASRVMRPLALLAIAALAAPGAALANTSWASVGSTGITDESCFYFAVQMEGPEARSTPGVIFPCKLRYQVTDTFDGVGTIGSKNLYAHIRDTSAVTSPGNVVVNLYSYRKSDGMRSLALATINSNINPPGPTVGGFTEYKSAAGCIAAPHLDFATYNYWIEVDLMPAVITPLTGGLAIASVQLRSPC